MLDPRGLATQDPLGLGGLLVDAYRLVQLGAARCGGYGLVEPLLAAALAGLRHYVEQPDLRMPAGRRLAFRELGLAIGLAAIEGDAWRGASRGVRARVWIELSRYLPLRAEIEAFWLRAGASPDGQLARARGHQRRDAGDEPPPRRLPRHPRQACRLG